MKSNFATTLKESTYGHKDEESVAFFGHTTVSLRWGNRTIRYLFPHNLGSSEEPTMLLYKRRTELGVYVQWSIRVTRDPVLTHERFRFLADILKQTGASRRVQNEVLAGSTTALDALSQKKSLAKKVRVQPSYFVFFFFVSFCSSAPHV